MNCTSFRKKTVYALGSIVIFLLLAVFADHFLLPHLTSSPPSQGLLFPPGSKFPYKTPEFAHTAAINALGFRDREWNILKNSNTTRILAIGDSFTFGMGVELEQTWPKLLESKLSEQGYAVEVANLGKAGADPAAYADIAKKAVPLLKPDIILIALLQGDDLAQTIRQIRSGQTKDKNTLLNRSAGYLEQVAYYLYPNTSRILKDTTPQGSGFSSKERLLENIWKYQAEKMTAGYTGEKKIRFESMGAIPRDMFLNGHLNPAIVNMAISDPQYFATTLEEDNALVMSGWRKIQDYLLEIATTAGDADIIVLSVPLGTFVSDQVWEGRTEMGFTTFSEMLRTNIPDKALEKICMEIGIPCISATEVFRRVSLEKPLFYKYDGHFNPTGHALFAEQVSPHLLRHLRLRKER